MPAINFCLYCDLCDLCYLPLPGFSPSPVALGLGSERGFVLAAFYPHQCLRVSLSLPVLKFLSVIFILFFLNNLLVTTGVAEESANILLIESAFFSLVLFSSGDFSSAWRYLCQTKRSLHYYAIPAQECISREYLFFQEHRRDCQRHWS